MQKISVGKARPLRAVDSYWSADRNAPHDGEVELELELEPGTRLLRAGEPPWQNRQPFETDIPICVGTLAELQTIDGVARVSMEPPLLAGRHVLTLNRAPTEHPIALETERLGVRHCDLIATGWPDQWQRDPFWFGDVRIAFTGIFPRLGYGGLRLFVGRWAGPLRLGGELGFLTVVDVDCPGDDCGEFGLPVAFDVSAWRRLGAGGGLFGGLGARAGVLAAPTHEDGPLVLRAVSLQATAEVLVGTALREGREPAPAGPTTGIGVEAGPALVLGKPDAGLGFALGVHLTYGVAP